MQLLRRCETDQGPESRPDGAVWYHQPSRNRRASVFLQVEEIRKRIGKKLVAPRWTAAGGGSWRLLGTPAGDFTWQFTVDPPLPDSFHITRL